ncbi:ATP-binding protein [Stagnihabitans tardus]|uniref:histidine kinase n=1 Tax=Stagnihabitans tardus TaxID=2699202 RepID=A0AAE4YDC5_9RHOB|nr:ATP-binding protein [Stagnihabitans tardus]NBZ87495.1 response regulator [Stagnihabitans tardus]
MAVAAALAAGVVAWAAPTAAMRMGGALVALSLVFLALGLRLRAWAGTRAERTRLRQLTELVGQDATPCFMTDRLGEIRYQNAAAEARFQSRMGATLVATMSEQFASPSSVLFRLQNRALHGGSGREDVVTRRGHIRLSVARMGDDRFMWRLEEFQDRGAGRGGADALSLPMLTANKAGVILYSNEAMRRLVGGRPKRLDRIFNTPILHSGEEVEVQGVDGPTRAILAELDGPGERREIYLLPVPEGTPLPSAMADFEHVPVPLAKFGPNGALIVANAAARAILNLTGEPGVMFHDLLEGLGRPVSDWLDDIVSERAPSRSEMLRARLVDGEVFLQVMLRRIVEHGRPEVLAVLQDATAFKTLEAQFVQSQKMQAIGQLAGGIAHDFNNLLTAISGHCDLLLMRHEREDSDYGDLVQIHQNANRAASLVSQLLAYSRKQTLKPERLDLEDVLSELAHLLNRLVGERIRLQLNHGLKLGAIRADKRQLEQVLMNLVVNARDAMPQGGVIRVDTEAISLSEPLVRDRATVPAGDYAVIKVQDSGSGIPADRLQKIFEPFYTTKKVGEGTGLGLSTAYGIVKQSGGFIFVDSEVGAGSTFSLYFPIHSGPADLVEEKKKVVLKQGEGVVLLVEDEAPVRAFASRALRMRGYTVLEAENAEEALRTLEDPSLNVDVFVTDVVMPGMDGPSWVRQALEERPHVKVIFVSGYAEDALSETQSRIPNSVFLPKPFSLGDLTATVQGQMQMQ